MTANNTPTIEQELVDEHILQQMIKDTCAEIIPTLIEHYIEESRERMEKIEQALSAKDLQTLEFEVHTLGSSALALGNRTLSRQARMIEKYCVEGKTLEALALCESLSQLAIESFDALEKRKDQGFE
ncbi:MULTISPECIES: Hpt domain-containing protein [Vibrio]|jgi:HPt (histidine-containing phosphotransfer) domain-containing protein|uniref:Signal transduction histidine kinase n=1 Tax=Vibrio antiquarius (strain Ex25) TaxID=150340 RepID=A0ACA6QML0_VIBAE|nr:MULTISPECIES: Hpt domain-containing protein [Vibrio]MCR9496056.1 Hpt domain-containing protein [Vibrio alginolyticus]MEA3480480.1 Hpt domain-containing protein [Pseudomonadota bacterium]ACY51692.1 signal transduction histidine kinase [Vibrio antiquarius]KLE25768.1 phosphorelay protein LuxU [Vibrio diabolicus]MCA2414336.1 Hpt domain-containing protein [Vibrio chemaguriensis]